MLSWKSMHGYQWSLTVGKHLTLLITGEKPGSKKLEKAQALGIRILSWDEFAAALQLAPPDKDRPLDPAHQSIFSNTCS